jgi:phosphoribosylaminoimidazole carboxylase
MFDQDILQKRIGIVGGGQLGRMLTVAAIRLGFSVVVLDAEPNCPAAQVGAEQVIGSLRDAEALAELARRTDVITVEIEHLDASVLAELERDGAVVYPAPRVVALIQDKFAQKEFLAARGLAVAPFHKYDSPTDLDHLPLPLILKARLNAYDGRGNVTLHNLTELPQAIEKLGSLSLYVEEMIPFAYELTVMVARGVDGTVRSFPPVRTIHQEHILRATVAPLYGETHAAVELAEKAVAALDTVGIFGVEMFALTDGTFLINEIAPRPHNSGHYTIEACHTSQFEQHIRAVTGLPLGDPTLKVPAAIMLNILGDDESQPNPDPYPALEQSGVAVHWYGKSVRPRRKVGHLTIIGTPNTVFAKAAALHPALRDELFAARAPQVGIIMGSDSDLPTMRAAAELLRELQIGYEIRVVSAHRTPDRMREYAHSAAARGIQVIIAGAGGAAHLPGMVASMTDLPVIGVPVRTEPLSGVDALYSIVQMPKGIPVATVAIGNAANAGLLAARILGASDPEIRARLTDYRTLLEKTVLHKAEALEKSDEGHFLPS